MDGDGWECAPPLGRVAFGRYALVGCDLDADAAVFQIMLQFVCFVFGGFCVQFVNENLRKKPNKQMPSFHSKSLIYTKKNAQRVPKECPKSALLVPNPVSDHWAFGRAPSRRSRRGPWDARG